MTIKEIAQLAGVSSAAVSRYLNGGYVSEEKRDRSVKSSKKPDTSHPHRRVCFVPKGKPGGRGRPEDQF